MGAPRRLGSRLYLELIQSLTKLGRRDLHPRRPAPIVMLALMRWQKGSIRNMRSEDLAQIEALSGLAVDVARDIQIEIILLNFPSTNRSGIAGNH